MDTDTLADFNFILGDLNYRLESSFSELNDETINLCHDMLKDREQLTEARKKGLYPLYEEPEIKFKPSYKMYDDKNSYFNKKD